MEQTDEMIREDIRNIIWVLWPKRELTAQEIHDAIKGNLNRPWNLMEIEGQLDALVTNAEFVKSGGAPAKYRLLT